MATIENPGISMAQQEEDDDEATEMLFDKRSRGRGCCFCIPNSSYSWWENLRTTTDSGEDKWWKKGLKPLMKVREWSEIIAGPKWKTFIRRFNKSSRSGGGAGCLGGGGGKSGKFQYDPMSYALNFDHGPGQGGHSDEEYVYPDFSSRYAAIPASAKSSVDLGKDGSGFV